MERVALADQCLSNGAQAEEDATPAVVDDTPVENGHAPFTDYVIERERIEAAQRSQARSKEFLSTIMDGPDLLSWVAPTDDADSDEVLAEHLVQLRNAVRYALQFGARRRVPDGRSNLSARECGDAHDPRQHRAGARTLKAAKSKTVRGGACDEGPQD